MNFSNRNKIARKSLIAQAVLWVATGGTLVVHPSVVVAANFNQPIADAESEESVDTGVSKTEVPTTKQLIGRSALEQSMASDGSEAVKDVAGVSSSTSQGSANPATSIRGLQLNLYSNYRLNGGLPTTGIVSVPMENKEAVEVLKGANALQFGLANPAGIINYVTKRAKEIDVTSASLNGNTFGQYGAAFDVGRKFGVDREFGVRINGAAQHLESGVVGASGHGEFFSFAGDWQVTKDLVLRADYEKISKDVIEQAQIGVMTPTTQGGTVTVPKVPDPTVLLSGPFAWYRPRTENIDLKAEYKINPEWKMLAEVGRSDSTRVERMTDQIKFTTAAAVNSGSGTDGYSIVNDQQYHNRYFRTEFYGKLKTWSYDNNMTFGYSSAERFQNLPNANTPTGVAINIYNPVLRASAPVIVGSAPASTYTPTTSSDAGPYVYDTLSLSEELKLTAGFRSTNYYYSATTNTGAVNVKNIDVFSPAFAVSYQIAPKTNVYASVMSSFEDGGVAPANNTNAYQVLEPTAAKQREVGIKSTYFDGIRSSFTYFVIERANNYSMQVGTAKTFVKDGTLLYQGVETTNNILLSKYWSMDISGQWLTATQNPELNMLLDGKQAPGVSKLSGSVRFVHTSPDVAGLKLNFGANAASSKFVDNYETASIPSYTTYSAGGSYATRIEGVKTTFTAQIENITDERYFSGVNGTTYAIGLPRSLRFNMRMDF